MPGKCTFNDNWTSNASYKDWVIRDPSSKVKARCRFCQKSFDCSNMGESALRSHMNGKKHKELASLIVEGSTPITQFISASNTSSKAISSSSSVPSTSGGNLAAPKSSDPVRETLVSSYLAKEDTLKAEIRWTLHVVEKHHSFHSNEGIEKVFQDMFPDSATASKFSCGEKKCSYIACFGLAPYFAKLLKEKVEKEDSFVLLFDESLNFITKNKQLDVFIRFWDDNKVVSRYLTSQFLGHATSEDLLDHFNKATETLDLRKLLQVCRIFVISLWAFNLRRERGGVEKLVGVDLIFLCVWTSIALFNYSRFN